MDTHHAYITQQEYLGIDPIPIIQQVEINLFSLLFRTFNFAYSDTDSEPAQDSEPLPEQLRRSARHTDVCFHFDRCKLYCNSG